MRFSEIFRIVLENNKKSHDIRSHFNIPEDVPIIPVIATEMKGISLSSYLFFSGLDENGYI